MVQFLTRNEDPSVRIGQQLAGIVQSGMEGRRNKLAVQEAAAERQNFKEKFGIDLSKNPDIAKIQMAEALKGDRKKQEWQMFQDYMSGKGKPDSPGMQENDQVINNPFNTEGRGESKIPDPMEKYALGQINNMLGQFAAKDEAEARADVRADKKLAQQEKQRSEEREHRKVDTLRKETMDVRKEYNQKSKSAIEGIKNKRNMLEMIETGNLDNPAVAAILEALPGNIGKSLLSPETVRYKSALIDEFKDLRNIFQGQTRVKELELLEQKIPDIYLTDTQKKAIISSRMDALKADVIKGEVAAELEEELDSKGKFLGLSQFQNEVEKRAKKKLDSLFDSILDEQASIVKNAENRKKSPLNLNDPDDVQVIDQILEEAGGNVKKAEQLARKRGYSW